MAKWPDEVGESGNWVLTERATPQRGFKVKRLLHFETAAGEARVRAGQDQ